MNGGAAQDGWADLLQPGEQVLWQGRPDAALRLSVRDPMEFGLGFALTFGPITPLLLLWLGGNTFWPLLLAPMALGLWFLAGWCLLDAYRRRRTWYSLTDRRGFVATALLGRRRLSSFPLGPDMLVEHDRKEPGSLEFDVPQGVRARFERIADAWTVADLARQAAVRSG